MIRDRGEGIDGQIGQEERLGAGVKVAAWVAHKLGCRFAEDRVIGERAGHQRSSGGVEGCCVINGLYDHLLTQEGANAQTLVRRLQSEAIGGRTINAIDACEIMQDATRLTGHSSRSYGGGEIRARINGCYRPCIRWQTMTSNLAYRKRGQFGSTRYTGMSNGGFGIERPFRGGEGARATHECGNTCQGFCGGLRRSR